jgi:hypothetical protein
MARVEIDTRGFDKLLKQLEDVKTKAVPYAMREYVNSAAFAARTGYIERAKANMVLRSKWTEKSVQVDKAKSLKVSDQQAVVGSVADYMATQESGATEGKHGQHGVPIPAAAPGRRKGRKSKTPTANQLSRLTLASRGVKGIRQKRNAAAIAIAGRRGGGVVFLDLRKTKGLFRVSAGKKNLRIKKLWDLSKGRITIPRNPMLQQAIAVVTPQLPDLGRKAIEFQFRRHKLFGY